MKKFSFVGFGLTDQQIPFSVMVLPGLEVILPPHTADLLVIYVIPLVLSSATEERFPSEQEKSKTNENKPHIKKVK
jgi:hypothetical protein